MSDDFRERWNRLSDTAAGAEYQSTHTADGWRYAKRVGEQWEPISDEDAKSAGVWRNPRGGQYHVRDELATTEQVTARMKGRYDAAPASGEFVAVRVKLLCDRCGDHRGDFGEFEHRSLFRAKESRHWKRSTSGLKCRKCFGPMEHFPVDLTRIHNAAEHARHTGRTPSIKIGRRPATMG